ncbi:MAG: glycoside hydrolase family 3 C-terminal domain-containing protein [Lachnospiraceae bacterium]|nr:glycoside hydrolase family 3 C-terminal domain-containing protein [Lachnospiraceae bacterium]
MRKKQCNKILVRDSYTEEAKRCLSKLNISEKIELLSGKMSLEEVRDAIQNRRKTHYNEFPYRGGGCEKAGIPPVLFVDGTRGVVCGSGKATCFPVSVLRGATFDPILERKIGEAIAEEVKAAGGNLFAGICVNLPYHPGWGRSQESYGEDTFLLGEMGAALTEGIQEKGIIACVKHFAFNSMENARFDVSISASKRAEREVFLPQFKRCIDAGAGAVMSSYNQYQGSMCGQNDYLLRKVLKEEWKFDGFVMTDFNWGIKDTVLAIHAGQDLEMPNTNFYGDNLRKAFENGEVEEKVIEEAALRIVRTVLSTQSKLQDSIQKNIQKKDSCNYKEHQKLALECAREGITMVKNENQILPLKGKRAQGNIVILGRLADQEVTGDKGSSQVYPPYVTTILKGIQKAATGAEIIYYNGDSLSHSKRLAKEADTVIVVVGNDFHDEGEYVKSDDGMEAVMHMGGDRQEGVGLKERDRNLIMEITSVRKDAIVVLLGGGMIMMQEWISEVAAVLLSYYPGMEGGTAIGEILFGKVNPSGKLPFVVPKRETDLPKIDWKAKEQVYEYYRGYTLLQKKGVEPLFPFGYGLSYTTFTMYDMKVWQEQESIYASIQVNNNGKREGDEIVQMYVGVPNSTVERPERILKAFQRVHLKKGESKRVVLSCRIEDMGFYDEEKGTVRIEYTTYAVYLGNSSDLNDLQKYSFLLSAIM